MRVWFVTIVFLAMIMSPLVDHSTELEGMQKQIQSSSPIQTTLSSSSGWRRLVLSYGLLEHVLAEVAVSRKQSA
jgi:hypothetical protein